MRAWVIRATGGLDRLEIADVPDLAGPLEARQVRIAPRAAALIADAHSTKVDAPPVAEAAAARRPASESVTTAPVRQGTEGVPAARSPDAAPVAPLAATPVPAHQGAEGATAPTPLAPAAKNLTGGFSIARQLGLGVSRIVIDAGHGGHDPGAQARGLTEAELVLDVTLRLEKLLQKVPGVEVVLTRRSDEFIPLQERTAIANREGADLFLSIHANASPSAHRNVFSEFREQPQRGCRCGAGKRRVESGDGRAARFRESDRAEQQAR